MPDTKITALTAIGANPIIPSTFPIPMVDLTDTSMAGSGTTKKVTVNQILGAGGTATLASATITGDLTVDTSTLKVDSANNRVGIGTASPSYILDILGASPRLHIRDNGTGFSLLDIENGAGTFYVGRENSTGSGGLSGVPYAGILYLQGAYPIICGTNFTERYRIASDGVATWSNVGGVAGTAMTLNATGLGVGTSPRSKLDVNGGLLVNNYVTSTNYAPLSVTTASVITTPSTFTNAISIYNPTNVGAYSNITFGYNALGITNAGAYIGYVSTSSAGFGKGDLVFGTRDVTTDTAATERLRIDSSGNVISNVTGTAPTLATNSQMVFNLTSNTNLRISVRGTDGTTRTADITLA